ncbi:MAG TPA: FAD-dependent oxidoreductase [Steroidobacteraceae bacterium]|nr:FAD-dependent oxidoreductase [Steroidobacteraceae bacterium]
MILRRHRFAWRGEAIIRGSTKAFDFIVVGAGMAGTSVAAALASTAKVALIEAESQPGFHATGRSAALFAPNYGSPLFRALTRASAAFLQAPPAGFAAHSLLQPRGALYLAREDQQEQLEATRRAICAANSLVEVLSPAEARMQVPRLRSGYVIAALYEPEVYDIDVAALLQGFLRQAKSLGARLHLAARCSMPQRHGETWRIRIDAETLAAPVLVNAAGAWADELAIGCGAQPLGLRPLRRTAALIEAPTEITFAGWPAVFDIDEQFYFKPDASRLLISPADEEPCAPGDAYADDLMVAMGVERIESALDFQVRRITHSWAGLRTFAPDREPVIGFDALVPGLFWCAAQGGYGIQSAAAGAQLAAALARREAVPAAIAAAGVTAERVSPERFSPGAT